MSYPKLSIAPPKRLRVYYCSHGQPLNITDRIEGIAALVTELGRDCVVLGVGSAGTVHEPVRQPQWLSMSTPRKEHAK